MTPQDLRIKYNKETGNETYPCFNKEYDYVKWLEEKVLELISRVSNSTSAVKQDTILEVQGGKHGHFTKS